MSTCLMNASFYFIRSNLSKIIYYFVTGKRQDEVLEVFSWQSWKGQQKKKHTNLIADIHLRQQGQATFSPSHEVNFLWIVLDSWFYVENKF